MPRASKKSKASKKPRASKKPATSRKIAVSKTEKRPSSPAGADNPWQSLVALRKEMDDLLADFSSRFPVPHFGWPDLRLDQLKWFEGPIGPVTGAVNLVEKDKEFLVTAELPGMSEKDIEVGVSGGLLTIKGEKSEEKEEEKKGYHLSERRYGSFQRSFRLPDGVNVDKISATLEMGVLSISLPKTPDAVKKQKTIPIKSA